MRRSSEDDRTVRSPLVLQGVNMSLALVQVASTDFDWIYGHLVSHNPKYRNMHLRETRTRNKQRELRYLHAMHAKPNGPREIEGMISGPDILCHYKLMGRKRHTQLNVLVEQADPKAQERLGRRFLTEVMARIDEERVGNEYFPRRTPGQFYLRRKEPGMPATHPNCMAAIAEGVLDLQFVSLLSPWGFELLHP